MHGEGVHRRSKGAHEHVCLAPAGASLRAHRRGQQARSARERGQASMDDVGQTLLNWAAAFGTQEMVEFLCQKGADVNKGQRSSSLHYAACFGRPQIAQVLLRFGANPDLRDEDGKTPLDKAREGNNEGHREVANILQVWPITFFFASPQKKLICFKGK